MTPYWVRRSVLLKYIARGLTLKAKYIVARGLTRPARVTVGAADLGRRAYSLVFRALRPQKSCCREVFHLFRWEAGISNARYKHA